MRALRIDACLILDEGAYAQLTINELALLACRVEAAKVLGLLKDASLVRVGDTAIPGHGFVFPGGESCGLG